MTVLRETTYNNRAGKHTFVIRAYKGSNGDTKFYRRIGNKLFVQTHAGDWLVLIIYNDILNNWIKRVFGMEGWQGKKKYIVGSRHY
jgi:hypothetical protein